MLFTLGTLDLLPVRERAIIVTGLLEGLVTANRLYLSRVGAPKLYESGMRYVATPAWKDIPSCLSDRRADCKGLVAWRLAELRVAGEQAYARVEHFRMVDGDKLHLQVMRATGEVEDPSRKLGMT